MSYRIYSLIVFALCLLQATSAHSQIQQPGAPLSLGNTPQRDTNTNKTNTSEWRNYNARISFKKLNSEVLYTPDTSLHTFHRRPLVQPWYRDLGNHGSPARDLVFTPENRLGPTLGYHVFDIYRYNLDSLNYYNTNRPYSAFGFQLGGKLEQTATIMHTQNIKPNWNIAVQYRKITSPGFYPIQRTNHDNAFLTSNYQSKDQRYELNVAMVYNKQQNDENGGIKNDKDLEDGLYNSQTIPVNFREIGSASRYKRSSVTNNLRDAGILLQHSYSVGRTDTLYNEDSTHFRTELTPRFRITHRMQISSERYEYKDKLPDSLRYDAFFKYGFPASARDSVFTAQNWLMVDNRVLLNGFIGPKDKQLSFNAGVGNRYDRFNTNYAVGTIGNNITSNYVLGEIKKEALDTGQWFYRANATFYVTGEAAGNSAIQAEIGKDLGIGWATLFAGVSQHINNAPYNYTYYQNRYDTIINSFGKESVTQLYGTIAINPLKFSAGIRNYLVGNYIYLNDQLQATQDATPFNLTQLWVRKVFYWRSVVFDNELVYQQPTGGAPVNVPGLLGRHQLSLERYILKKALKVATGVEVRYHTDYKSAGYTPFFNRFYYQNAYTVSNTPEGSVFFNFQIKRFRAYFAGDQVQQFFSKKLITAPGYPGQEFMIRFGFNWVMIN